MTKSEPSNSGCFSSIIRRMLCTGNVPTHPSSSSDHITEHPKPNSPIKININNYAEKEQGHHAMNRNKLQTGPTLVARLMGLDSLPPNTDFPPNRTTPDSLSRSRSVNFADYLLKLDLTESHHHRRVRTSVSFREVPVLFHPQSRDFVVVSTSERKEKRKRSDQGVVGSKGNDNENRIWKLKNEPRRKVLPKASKRNYCERKNGALGSVLPRERSGCSGVKSRVSKRENAKKVTEKFVRNRKSQHRSRKIQPIESNPENTSPVSVLNDALFSEGHSRPVKYLDFKMELEPKISYHRNDLEVRSAEEQNHGKITSNKNTCDYTELAELLLNLTKQDLSESCWISNTKNVMEFEGFEEICMEFEGLILDVLLHEVTSEIVQI